MAERWVVHPAAPRVSRPRLGYDFVEGRTHDGRKFRILTIIDEASRECLALIVARQLRHEDVLAALADLFIARGPPGNIRSDNGSKFTATAVQKWLAQVGVQTLYITPASPWENGSNDSFNGSLRVELLITSEFEEPHLAGKLLLARRA